MEASGKGSQPPESAVSVEVVAVAPGDSHLLGALLVIDRDFEFGEFLP